MAGHVHDGPMAAGGVGSPAPWAGPLGHASETPTARRRQPAIDRGARNWEQQRAYTSRMDHVHIPHVPQASGHACWCTTQTGQAIRRVVGTGAICTSHPS